MTVSDELIQYYSNHSKHSNYQVLPKSLKKIIGDTEVQTRSRYEPERLDYILSKVDVKDKTALDIGANTGYFSFELLEAGAREVTCYEGNQEHAEFIKLAAEAIGQQDKIKVFNEYYLFDKADHHDIVLLLNILHHVGDDYGEKSLSRQAALGIIINQLNAMSKVTDTLIFQLDFNWHGNPKQGLFPNGTKAEMIDFIKSGTANTWRIDHIAIAQKFDDGVRYIELDNDNIKRDDSLGEFLNRPLFILKSGVKV